MASLGQLETKIGPLCKELGITKQTLYRHLAPNGDLREDGKKLLEIFWVRSIILINFSCITTGFMDEVTDN